MNEEEKNVGMESVETSQADTTTAQTEEGNTTEKCEGTNCIVEQQEQATTYTQEKVNEIVRERLERDRKSLYSRYGVEDKTGLDDLIGKALSYDVMLERYEKAKADNKTIAEELAFVRKNINPERKADIQAYFKGKELDFSEDALEKELTTHPEWLNVVEKDDTPKTTISYVSKDRGDIVEESDKDKVAKLFGLSKIL